MSSGKAKRIRLIAARVSNRAQHSNTLAEQQQLVTEEAHNFRITEPTGGANSHTIFTVFHIKESKLDVERRIASSRRPIFYSTQKRYADPHLYSQVVPIPLRPPWNNRLSKEELHANEMEKFEEYLKVIYDNIPPSRLTHFEHNLDVWRQLWRVCETSDLLCVTVDSRHPLFHFPPALYDYIVNKLQKPILLVLNKVDLVPLSVLTGWVQYLSERYPEVHIVPFTSHPNPESVTGEEGSIDSILSREQLRTTGAGAIKKSPPVGSVLLKSFWNILAHELKAHEGAALTNEMVQRALAVTRRLGYLSVIDIAEMASKQDDEIDATFTADLDELRDTYGTLLVSQDDEQILMQKIRERTILQQQRAQKQQEEQEQPTVQDEIQHTAAVGNDIDDGHGNDDDEEVPLDDLEFLQKLAIDSDDEDDAPTKSMPNGDGYSDDDDDDSFDYHNPRHHQDDDPQSSEQLITNLTVGMVGHPNAGKSSLINAILGRPAVSVSSAPGHTKHLQTLSSVPNCPGVKLCDCPGLVFPAVDVSRSLQTLLGIFPYPRLSEPFTCVQFLAERLPLVDLYNLFPYLGEESDAKLYGAATPGGNSAFIENHHVVMLETNYTGDDDEEERRMGLLCSASTATRHPIFLPGTLTTQLPEKYRSVLPQRAASRPPGAHQVESSSESPLGKDAPIIVNGVDISSLAPTRPLAKGKGGKKNQKNKAPVAAPAKKTTKNRNNANADDNLYNDLDLLFSDTQLDPTTHPRFVWSAYRICESLAQRRGWFKEGGPDCFRAGMSIVKDCVEGRLNLYFFPPKA